jgi:hypothetical protein
MCSALYREILSCDFDVLVYFASYSEGHFEETGERCDFESDSWLRHLCNLQSRVGGHYQESIGS